MTDHFTSDKFLGVRVWQPYLDKTQIFSLYLYDTFTRDGYGKSILAYQFFEKDKKIFEGDDFCCSPLHAIDSDETFKALLGFLTLRPGDTDEEYFDDYTERQMEFANEHAEVLSIYAMDDE